MVHFKTFPWITCFALTAGLSTGAAEGSTLYKLSPEESRSFLAQKRNHNPSYQPFKPFTNGSSGSNPDTFSLVDTSLDCISHNVKYTTHERRWGFQSARCDWPSMNRKYYVQCKPFDVKISPDPEIPHTVLRHGRSREFTHYCEEREVCMPTLKGHFVDPESSIKADDIECVDGLDVHKIEFWAVQEAGNQECTSALRVPGARYTSTYSTGVTDFVLTADLTWSNGKPYKAPSMFIRDESAKHPYDRAFRLDTDVVSATMSVGSYRGRLQSRLIRFCFEQLTGGDGWAVLAFTWFKAPAHKWRGRVGSDPARPTNFTAP